MMKKLLPKFLVLLLLPCVLLVGCKPSTSNDIRVNGKTLSFMMTKDEVENLIGEGELIESYQAVVTATMDTYQYDGFSLQFATHTDETTPYLIYIKWTSPDIATFNGINIGSSYEEMQKKMEILDSKTPSSAGFLTLNYAPDQVFYNPPPHEYDRTQLDTQYVYKFDLDTQKVIEISAHSYNQYDEKFPLKEN